jgi:hypothetical protein
MLVLVLVLASAGVCLVVAIYLSLWFMGEINIKTPFIDGDSTVGDAADLIWL